MKKKQTIIVMGALLFGIVLCAVAVAGNWQGRQFTKHRAHGSDELRLLTGFVHKNLMVQALAEITGQPVENLNQQFKDRPLRAVLGEYRIDRDAFHTALRAKTDHLVQKLVESGYITPEQDKYLAEKVEIRSQRRALMTRLVEKGVEDGTITGEQARMLMPKQR
jgi:polyhydroxyalkanoate synthesis regulator phasin